MLIGELYLPHRAARDLLRRGRLGVHLPFNFQLIGATPGTRGRSPRSSRPTRPRCPPGALAQLGARQPRPAAASPAASGRAQARVAADAPAHAARHARRCTTATRSGCTTSRSRRSWSATRARRTCPASASAATRSAPRCSGTAARTPGLPPGTPWLPVADDSARVNVEAQRDDQPLHALAVQAPHPAAARAPRPDRRFLSAGRDGRWRRWLLTCANTRTTRTRRARTSVGKTSGSRLPEGTAGAKLLCSTDPERHAFRRVEGLETWTLRGSGAGAVGQESAGSTVADMEPLQRGIRGSGPKAWIWSRFSSASSRLWSRPRPGRSCPPRPPACSPS